MSAVLLTGLTLLYLQLAPEPFLGAVSRDEQNYTELYFPDHRSLPKRTVTGQPSVFEVAIANHEGRRTEYELVVTLQGARGPEILARARLSVDDADIARHTVSLLMEAPASPTLVSIDLEGRPETIGFWTAS